MCDTNQSRDREGAFAAHMRGVDGAGFAAVHPLATRSFGAMRRDGILGFPTWKGS